MTTLRAPRREPLAEPRGYVRGGFGDEMDVAYSAVVEHFRTLPGWRDRAVDDLEVVYLTGFFAFVALASSPTVRFSRSEAATGARASVARCLMRHGSRAQLLTTLIRAFQARLNEYMTLWLGVLKGDNSFGAFASCVFAHVQAGEKTRDGYVEHLNAFPEFCERRIKALHVAVPVKPAAVS